MHFGTRFFWYLIGCLFSSEMAICLSFDEIGIVVAVCFGTRLGSSKQWGLESGA